MVFIMLMYILIYYFVKSFPHKWMLNLSNVLLGIYWDDHKIFSLHFDYMILILQFVNVIYHIDL